MPAAIYTTKPPLTRTLIGTSTAVNPPGDWKAANSYIRVVEGRSEGAWNPATSNEMGFRHDAVKEYQDTWDPTGFATSSDNITLFHKAGHCVLTTFSPRHMGTSTAYSDDTPGGTFTTSIDTVGPVDTELTTIYARIHSWPWNTAVDTGMVIPGTGNPMPGVKWGGHTPSMMFLEMVNEPNASSKNLGTPDEYCKWIIQCVKVYKRYLRDNPTEIQRIYFCTGMAATGSANMSSYLPWHGFNSDGTQKAWCLKNWVVPGADVYFPYAASQGTGNTVTNPVDISSEKSIPDEPTRFKPFEKWVETQFGFDQSFVWPEAGFRYVQETDLAGGNADICSPLDISSATGDPSWRNIQLNGGKSRRTDIPGGQPVNGLIDWLQSARNQRSDGGPRLAVMTFWAKEASTLVYHPTYIRGRGAYNGRGSINGEFRDGHVAIRNMLNTLRGSTTPPVLGPPTSLTATTPTSDAPQVTLSWVNDGLADNIHLKRYAGTGTGGTLEIQFNIGHAVGDPVPTSFQPAPQASATKTYWLQSIDAAGVMETTGATVTVVYPAPVDVTAPTIPAGVVVTPAYGQGSVSWTASTDPDPSPSGVAGYDVAIDGTTKTNTAVISTTSYLATGLSAGVHTARVRAIDNATNTSAWSGPVSFTVPADTTKPTVPTGLSALPNADTAVFSWLASTDTESGVASYDIAIDGNTGTPDNITPITVLTYTSTGLGFDTLHSVQVRALDVVGNASDWSTPVIFTTQLQVDTEKPVGPTSPHTTVKTVSTLTVVVTAATDNVAVTGYRWTLNGVIQPDVVATASPAFAATNLLDNTSYTFVIRAYDAAFNLGDPLTYTDTTLTSGVALPVITNAYFTIPDAEAPVVTDLVIEGNAPNGFVRWNLTPGDPRSLDPSADEGGIDSGQLVFRHNYPYPGRYPVQAMLYSADGTKVSDPFDLECIAEYPGGLLTSEGIPLALPGEKITEVVWNRIAKAVNSVLSDFRARIEFLEKRWSLQFIVPGVLAVGSNILPPGFAVDHATVIDQIAMSVGTAPTGASLIATVTQTYIADNTSAVIATITIPAGSLFTSKLDNRGIIASKGDRFTVNVTQVGSIIAGSNLRVRISSFEVAAGA